MMWMSFLVGSVVTIELLMNRLPPDLTMLWNLVRDGSLSTMMSSIVFSTGAPIGSSEITT